MMWHVSPVASGPTMRLVETTLAVNGDLFLYVLTGTPDWSQYGSASRKDWSFAAVAVAFAKAASRSMRTAARLCAIGARPGEYEKAAEAMVSMATAELVRQ